MSQFQSGEGEKIGLKNIDRVWRRQPGCIQFFLFLMRNDAGSARQGCQSGYLIATILLPLHGLRFLAIPEQTVKNREYFVVIYLIKLMKIFQKQGYCVS